MAPVEKKHGILLFNLASGELVFEGEILADLHGDDLDLDLLVNSP